MDDRFRLCIPNNLEKEIFELVHDQQFYGGFNRTYARIVSTMFIKSLKKRLRKYIDYCPPCNNNQTKRHKPYGILNLIQTPPIPMYIVAIDFVVALPNVDGSDLIMTITYKFSKRVLIIRGRSNWIAE